MVCTFVVNYSPLSGDTGKLGLEWVCNIDPPEEISGKECLLKLVHVETGYDSTATNRFPFIVSIPSLTQRKSRYSVQAGTLVQSDSLNNTIVGFGAINDSGGIQNPSIEVYIPPSPQQWKIQVTQLNTATGYLGKDGVPLSLVFQLTPITNF